MVNRPTYPNRIDCYTVRIRILLLKLKGPDSICEPVNNSLMKKVNLEVETGAKPNGPRKMAVKEDMIKGFNGVTTIGTETLDVEFYVEKNLTNRRPLVQ